MSILKTVPPIPVGKRTRLPAPQKSSVTPAMLEEYRKRKAMEDAREEAELARLTALRNKRLGSA